MSGIERIAAERQRQIDAEGWTPEHDTTHNNDEMAKAAAVYATPPHRRLWHGKNAALPMGWPWGQEWFKPSPDNRIRELEKAGALIAAEIDRLERA